MSDNVIALASDHAGFDRKQAIKKYFDNERIKYDDLGCYDNQPCDYPDFAHSIAQAISEGKYMLGITFCGTGQGISMTANKHSKIRSAICWNPEVARLAREHNNANICAIPGRFVSDDKAIRIVKAFLNSSFKGGRHQLRIDKIPLQKPDCF